MIASILAGIAIGLAALAVREARQAARIAEQDVAAWRRVRDELREIAEQMQIVVDDLGKPQARH